MRNEAARDERIVHCLGAELTGAAVVMIELQVLLVGLKE